MYYENITLLCVTILKLLIICYIHRTFSETPGTTESDVIHIIPRFRNVLQEIMRRTNNGKTD